MASKLSFHINGFDGKIFELLEQMQPALVKVFDFPSDSNVAEIRRRCPNTLIVYRQYTNLGYHDPADAYVAELTDSLNKLKGRGIVWEGLNEPILNNAQDATALNTWFVRYAELMHARGEQVAAFSFSTGNPRLELVPLLAPAATACDYIALHEYSAPPNNAGDLTRYRQFLAQLPAAARKPVIISETGVDDGNNHGWMNFLSDDQFLALLANYDNQLAQDANVIGATIFQYGAGAPFDTFNVVRIGNRLAHYVATATPVPPAPTPPPTPPPTPAPTPPSTYMVKAGDTLSIIARKFGVTVAAIVALNHIANPNLIRVGQIIKIPGALDNPPPTPPPPVPTPSDVPEWYTPLPPATRPASAIPLQQFPRPANDNGRGIHFGLDVGVNSINDFIPRLVELGITWCLFYVGDEMQAEKCAVAAWNVGIMPIIRPKCKIDGQQPNWRVIVQRITTHNIPAYIQIYNEPGDLREWNHQTHDYLETFASKWADAATQVVAAGGYPGLQILGLEEITAAVNAIKANGNTDVWNRAFFALHNYGVNHPPAYPYDALNQKDHPRATIVDDDTAVLNLIAFAKWMYDLIGFVLPMIGGEGGWIYGSAEDNRYAKCNQPDHANYHIEMFNWFRTGKLSNGQALPDYLFSIAPWILFGFVEAEAWYGGPLGDKTETIAGVKAMPPFVRKFSWDK